MTRMLLIVVFILGLAVNGFSQKLTDEHNTTVYITTTDITVRDAPPSKGFILISGPGKELFKLKKDDKVIVLGLVTTKSPALEPVADIARRITEASRYVPIERLCISPQCGFASTAQGNRITEEDQWRKLERLLQVSQQVWGVVAA